MYQVTPNPNCFQPQIVLNHRTENQTREPNIIWQRLPLLFSLFFPHELGSVIPYYLQMSTMPPLNPTRMLPPRAHFSA
jgi:hypothetical protein